MEAFVYHLPPLKSNHNPILVELVRNGVPNRQKCPFHFLASWISHEDFDHFMRQNLQKKESWNVQISSFKKELQIWNKKIFGHIFTKKKKLLKQLYQISNSLTS